ncbi:MAG: GIY-YIG nuclease family protein [Fibrobacter sp.]|nr:GIY-YIG nuclease family protein [Fibrobacter sp.]
MLKCAGDRIYTGYAVDVEARYNQHVSGKGARFTKAFPPECILRTFELNSKEEALRLEARIKKLDRPRKELLAGMSGSGSVNASGECSAAGSVVAQEVSALLESLMSGLSETLQEKKARIRRAAKKRD